MQLPWIGMALAACALNAHAVGGFADVQIMDRDTGQILPVYRHRGENWVAGSPGARYAVIIHNLRGDRVLAVTSVDGVNVISGETAAYDQTGYVFGGGEQYAINGWRKSNQEIADFNFTTLSDSYAARTGRPQNVGIIGVALFLERPAPPPRPLPEISRDKARREAEDAASRAPESYNRAAPSAPLAQLQGGAEAKQAPERLGTGHGAREYSYVTQTQFDRMSNSPNEIIKIRYDSYENLVAMGVVRTRPTPAQPNAFPDAQVSRYVPDPPGA